MSDAAGTKRPCKGCGMTIEFLVGPNGKVIPVQRIRTVYSPNAEGALVNVSKLWEGSIIVRAGAYYVSHFETCPRAPEFSGRNRG